MDADNKIRYVSVDEMLGYVGQYGRYQIWALTLMTLAKFAASFQTLIVYFTAHNPPWQCVHNSTVCHLNGTFKPGDHLYGDRCHMPRDSWEYTTSDLHSVTTQFDLVCERFSLIHLLTSLYFISWGVGSILHGFLADKFGRFKVMYISSVVILVASFLSAFSTDYWMYLLARVAVGFFYPGQLVQMFTLANEYVGAKYRPLSGMLVFSIFSVALVAVGIKAIFFDEWKMLTIVATAPYFISLIPLWFTPESPRWLRIHGETEKAFKNLEKAAKINKRSIPDDVRLEPASEDIVNKKVSPLLLFVPLRMMLKSFNLAFALAVNAMVYYGVSLAVDDLGGDMHRDYILSSLVEFPALVASILCPMIFGRKKSVIIPQLLASAFCIAVSAIPYEGEHRHLRPLRITFGLIGKGMVTVSFYALYTWSVELYPTQIRSEGMGWLQITSRIGAALAPWIAKALIVYHRVLPFAVMGSSAFVSAIFLFKLKDTKDKPTAEVLDDMSEGDSGEQSVKKCDGELVETKSLINEDKEKAANEKGE